MQDIMGPGSTSYVSPKLTHKPAYVSPSLPHSETQGDQLEEDESFFVDPATHSSASAGPSPTLTPDVDTTHSSDLEEDPLFVQPAEVDIVEAGTGFATTYSRSLHSADLINTVIDEDDDLPGLSQILASRPQLPVAIRSNFDASAIDLGNRYISTKSLSGYTYNGKRVSFPRRRGNALVGDGECYDLSDSDKR